MWIGCKSLSVNKKIAFQTVIIVIITIMTGTETFHEVCGSFLHCFQVELEFRMLVFVKGGKEVPGEKHSEQGREPATNSTHM